MLCWRWPSVSLCVLIGFTLAASSSASGAVRQHAQRSGLLLRHQAEDVVPHRHSFLPDVHFVYTTGCDDYQLLHSIVLDHSWHATGNVGKLTRIVSGCKSDANKELMTRSPLKNMSNYSIFFANGDLELIPHTGERYPARSRPHAITQWMAQSPPVEEVICLIDPDFLFLKPLSKNPVLATVKNGRMVSTSWNGWGGPSGDIVDRRFKTGPVWLFTTSDLRRILPEWRSLTDSWHRAEDGGLMREQFAFQKSSENQKIPAVFREDLATEMLGPDKDVAALHYFLSYKYRGWVFHKALSSSGWYADKFKNPVPSVTTCGAPLLQEPPTSSRNPQAMTIATVIPGINRAAKAYRELYCPEDRKAFEEKGPAAFGLVHLEHPFMCNNQAGEITRFLVDEGSAASWNGPRPRGGDRCSKAALGVANV